MSAIFISYRREDTEGHAGRLFEVLAERFGKDSVFMDVAGIEPGRDFRKAIDSNVADCGALLAVIGKGWLTAKNEAGQRRIDDPHDFVRLETISALKRDIPVIPVLVHGAIMPRADQLPPELQELAFRNAVELTHARWDSDVQVLLKALERCVDTTAAPDSGRDTGSTAVPRRPDDAAKPAKSWNMKFVGIAGLVAAVAAGGAALYQRNAGEPVKDPEIGARKIDADQLARAAALKAEQDKAAAAQKEAAELKAKDEQAAKARAEELRAEEARNKQQADALEAAQAVAAREAELRAQEARIKQQTEALNATRLAAEKRAESDRLAKIERERKLAETIKPTIQGLGADGRKVTRVAFKNGAGHYRLVSPGAWIETGPTGNDTRFSFQETGRDDWSVYLLDRSRNVTLQLDLHRRWVVYQYDKPGERRDLYEITAAN